MIARATSANAQAARDLSGKCSRCGEPTDPRSAYCGGDCAAMALAEFRPPRREHLTWEEDDIAFAREHGPEVFR